MFLIFGNSGYNSVIHLNNLPDSWLKTCEKGVKRNLVNKRNLASYVCSFGAKVSGDSFCNFMSRDYLRYEFRNLTSEFVFDM